RLQPLLLRRRAHEPLEVAAGVQPLPSPVRGGQERNGDLLPDRRARLVVLVVKRMRENLVSELAAVFLQLAVGQGLVAAYQLAGDPAPRPAPAQPVLHRLHLHVVPVCPERGDDAAVVGHVAVPVGRALPDAHCGEGRRRERRDVPLVDAVVPDAAQADLAARPGPDARPLDAVVETPRLARREVVDVPRRAPAAARIHAHAGVALRNPFLRIDDLPVLVFVGRAVRDVGVLGDHALPGRRIPFLEREALGVGTVAEDDLMAPLLLRPEDVAAEDEPVVHADRYVPVDAHSVADLALLGCHRGWSTSLACYIFPEHWTLR